MMRKLAILPLVMIALAPLPSCMSVKEIPYSVSEADLAPYMAQGGAKVYGQAFLRQQGGGVVVCAGEPVLLVPNVGVFAEAYRLRKSGIQPKIAGQKDGRVFRAGIADPVASKAIRQAQCDAQGNFDIAGLPAGNWLLYSRVQWVVGEYSIQQGSDLIAEVITANSGEQKVLLTDNNRI